MNIIFTLTRESGRIGYIKTTIDGKHIVIPDYVKNGDVLVQEGDGFAVIRDREEEKVIVYLRTEDHLRLKILGSARLSPLNKALLVLGFLRGSLSSPENETRLLQMVQKCMGDNFTGLKLTCEIS